MKNIDNMNKLKLLVFLTLLISTLASCGKKIAPTGSTGTKGLGYDADAFNYLYVEAIKLKLMGNGSDALKYLEQCIKINRESDGSYYQISQILASSGDINNAIKFLNKAIELQPENIWYLKMMAGMYYQEQKVDSAIFYYEKAVGQFPDKEDLLLTLGNLYNEQGKYDRAMQIFNSLDDKYGINETSTLAGIRAAMTAKKYEDALVKVRLLHEKYPDELLYSGLMAEIYRGKGENERAIEIYNELMEKSPDDPQTQLSICDFLVTEKSYEELFRLLDIVVLNEKVKREDKIALLARLLELPDLISGYSDKFILTLMVLEANYPNDDVVPLLRPELYIKQGKLEAAAGRFEEIIKQRPQNYYAWEKVLLVYLQMGDFNKLTTQAEICASRFNMSFLAKLLYANGALETGKYSIAEDELKKAEILAGNSEEYKSQVLTMRADLFYRMKEYDKAFAIFDQLLKNDREDITVLNNYAYYLAEQGTNLKEAELMAKKVIEKEKDNITFLDTYAWVLYKRGKLKEAARIMESIVKSENKIDAVYYEHYGYILKKQKNCKAAIENWNMAIKLGSKNANLINEIEDCQK